MMEWKNEEEGNIAQVKCFDFLCHIYIRLTGFEYMRRIVLNIMQLASPLLVQVALKLYFYLVLRVTFKNTKIWYARRTSPGFNRTGIGRCKNVLRCAQLLNIETVTVIDKRLYL